MNIPQDDLVEIALTCMWCYYESPGQTIAWAEGVGIDESYADRAFGFCYVPSERTLWYRETDQHEWKLMKRWQEKMRFTSSRH